jgi:hypothetical protein
MIAAPKPLTAEEIERETQAKLRLVESIAREVFVRDAGSVTNPNFTKYPVLASRAFTAAEAFVKELERRYRGPI